MKNTTKNKITKITAAGFIRENDERIEKIVNYLYWTTTEKSEREIRAEIEAAIFEEARKENAEFRLWAKQYRRNKQSFANMNKSLRENKADKLKWVLIDYEDKMK
ncbi:hypothetical protein N5T90_06535 [Aliarcobacter cryaerophilus]|uniref:hypothetical protein n=1 Tax=Aliarcobacter cryaerophilus TaxID=28198 RepID=UPI0021B623B9|nr:hypothetical protein [Aliarcobacter cryaerophilus]MCT7470525.1 hypothetical protein [Aliarcobacter cryaerophilus]